MAADIGWKLFIALSKSPNHTDYSLAAGNNYLSFNNYLHMYRIMDKDKTLHTTSGNHMIHMLSVIYPFKAIEN